MESYIELHRNAAVRLALVASPDTALRLLIAHAVAASGNWTVNSEPQRSRSNEIKASIEQSSAQTAFALEREAITALLALPDGDGDNDDARTARVFEVAGKTVAKGNAAEKGTTQKQIVRDALAGRSGRVKMENWLPGWMCFPFKSYGDGACRIGTVSAAVAAIFDK